MAKPRWEGIPSASEEGTSLSFTPRPSIPPSLTLSAVNASRRLKLMFVTEVTRKNGHRLLVLT